MTAPSIWTLPERAYFKLGGQAQDFNVSTDCPHCGRAVRLHEFTNDQRDLRVHDCDLDGSPVTLVLGERMCPSCRGVVFVLFDAHMEQPHIFPPAKVGINLADVPPAVARATVEAEHCYAAGCYTASAIMVRKSVEEICREEGARGADLKSRLRDLRTKVSLPADLLASIDDIRLLGNDAAHTEVREFPEVGMTEVKAGLELIRVLLMGLYTYKSAMRALRGLKTINREPAPEQDPSPDSPL